jgi:serine kinase of HPr protein (carbohydrate metabolism regulator)
VNPSSESFHASSVALDGRAVLITGPWGSVKPDLARRLFVGGFSLVRHDQTLGRRVRARLLASAPPQIAGKLEVRGIGIVDVDNVGDVPVALIVELMSDMERLPDDRDRTLLGVPVPLVTIDAITASAPSKVALALDRLGLK